MWSGCRAHLPGCAQMPAGRRPPSLETGRVTGAGHVQGGGARACGACSPAWRVRASEAPDPSGSKLRALRLCLWLLLGAGVLLPDIWQHPEAALSPQNQGAAAGGARVEAGDAAQHPHVRAPPRGRGPPSATPDGPTLVPGASCGLCVLLGTVPVKPPRRPWDPGSSADMRRACLFLCLVSPL